MYLKCRYHTSNYTTSCCRVSWAGPCWSRPWDAPTSWSSLLGHLLHAGPGAWGTSVCCLHINCDQISRAAVTWAVSSGRHVSALCPDSAPWRRRSRWPAPARGTTAGSWHRYTETRLGWHLYLYLLSRLRVNPYSISTIRISVIVPEVKYRFRFLF